MPVSSATPSLTIATAWRPSEQAELETEFLRWLTAKGENPGPVAIHWLQLRTGDDLVHLAQARSNRSTCLGAPIDVLLGGPAACYVRLAAQNLLLAAGEPATPWRIVRRAAVGLAVNSSKTNPLTEDSRPAFDDPRHDPVALAWARATLARGPWPDGYAALVRSSTQLRRVGRLPRSGFAALARQDAVLTPAVSSDSLDGSSPLPAFEPVDPSGWLEGAAILQGGTNTELARSFLKFLAQRPDPAGAETSERGDGLREAPTNPEIDADELLADLLGSTLVDAQDELWAAWLVLRRAARPTRAERWMTQPPPWPPASVSALLERDRTGVLCDTLAEEICPDPKTRSWLVQSWLGPRRLIDGRLLAELAESSGGALVREPRFRAWLRAEWTAWARQRYRRVARQAGEPSA